MPTTQPYLEITDTVTSCKIMDSTLTTPAQIATLGYRLSFGGWAPNIARRNPSFFGLPYLPVEENLTIDIAGSTPQVCYQRLQDLNGLLDQAERWMNNEIVNPVCIKYQPLGSNISTFLKDVIIGGFADDNTAQLVTLPDDFNYTGTVSFLKGVRLRFTRKNGLWLGENESQSVTAVAQPGPLTVTWSDFANTLSPVDVSFGSEQAAGVSTHAAPTGYFAIAHSSTYIQSIDGVGAIADGGANQADAGAFPTNAVNVRRFVVNLSNSGLWNISPIPETEVEYIAAFAKVRISSSSVQCYIQGGIWSDFGEEKPLALSSNPQVAFLGVYATRGRTLQLIDSAIANSFFGISFRSASNVNIDVDTILIVGVNRSSNILGFLGPYISATSGVEFPQLSASNGVFLLHRLLNEPQGLVAQSNVPNDIPQAYNGVPYCFTGNSRTYKQTSAAIYMVQGAFWNLMQVGIGAKATMRMNATRSKAYLTPE
jgi:hypothetical protein